MMEAPPLFSASVITASAAVAAVFHKLGSVLPRQIRLLCEPKSRYGVAVLNNGRAAYNNAFDLMANTAAFVIRPFQLSGHLDGNTAADLSHQEMIESNTCFKEFLGIVASTGEGKLPLMIGTPPYMMNICSYR